MVELEWLYTLEFQFFCGASIFAIISAFIIAFITLKHRYRMDTFIGLMWAIGMAIGVIFIDLTSGYSVDLMSYLFGSILAVSKSDSFIYVNFIGCNTLNYSYKI